MKSEKGLSFIGTIILVIIIALITFGVVYYGRMVFNQEKTEDIKTNILLVKAKVQTISSDYILAESDDVLVGTKLSEMLEDEAIIEFLEKGLFDQDEEGSQYYVLNQQNLDDLGLSSVVLEDGSYYVVEYTSSVVYYTGGYMDEMGELYYTVTE